MQGTSQENEAAPIHKDRAGNTPLINAVIFGRVKQVREVTRNGGAEVNQSGWAGNTPLHIAVQLRMLKMIHVLLAAPAIDTSITNDAGKTALALAHEHHDRDVEREFRLAAMKAQRRKLPTRQGQAASVRMRRAPSMQLAR